MSIRKPRFEAVVVSAALSVALSGSSPSAQGLENRLDNERRSAMAEFKIHSIESAPQGSKPIMERLRGQVGFVPNLAATMAESPTMIDPFVTIRTIYAQGTLTGLEREVVALVLAWEYGCAYCVAAHSTFATKQGAAPDALKALRSGDEPSDPRLRALSRYTREMVRGKGKASPEAIQKFPGAGFKKPQLLEVAVGIVTVTLANHVYQLAETPVDAAFQGQAWHR